MKYNYYKALIRTWNSGEAEGAGKMKVAVTGIRLSKESI